MKILILYLFTAAIFFVIDAIGLRFMIKPVFDRHIAHLYADPFRVIPAAIFYLGYVVGVLWFVSVPALHHPSAVSALIGGALLGVLAYGTYEFTNYATLHDWSMRQVVVDTLWGGVLTGVSAWAGVVATRAMFASIG